MLSLDSSYHHLNLMNQEYEISDIFPLLSKTQQENVRINSTEDQGKSHEKTLSIN